MISEKNYGKILGYFDRYLWDRKTDDTNWNYWGINLDWHFNNSVLSIDYLDIEDFFEDNGGFEITDNKYLIEQYIEIEINKRLELLQNILNILSHSTQNTEQNNKIIERIKIVLNRDNVKVSKDNNKYITVTSNDILDSGSYCNIIKVSGGILRKELKPIYQNDVKLKKRLNYEFENMKKLRECPYILNVYEYDQSNDSYLMERGEKNLFEYLKDCGKLSFETKFKIIMALIQGMKFAHEKSIIHRDLHLGNIINIGADFVICDFGLSKDLSIERSMKSSYTEKNNHLFVDPFAISDFTKLDYKSDIYSIGKIIDFILTYNEMDTNHIFKTIVERCICRDRELRYESIGDILSDLEGVLKNNNKSEEKDKIISKIKNGIYDVTVHEFIINLINTDRLNKFIINNSITSFGKVVLSFENIYRRKIIQSIAAGYSEATGYGGWANYDVFAQIAYDIYINVEDSQVRNIARNILTECSNIRYTAKDLLEKLDS